MERTSNPWPVALALVCFIGFAVVRHAMDRNRPPATRAEPAKTRSCPPQQRPCKSSFGSGSGSVERVQRIRGLRLESAR